MGIRERLSDFGNEVVAELQVAAGNPEPKSVDRHMATVRGRSVEKHIPDKSKLEGYWELYENVSFIRNPIRSFASEVVAPGYYVKTDNEDLKEELEEWLKNSAIVDGDVDRDFRRLLKKATIQREVKGTAIIEKVPDDEGEMYGFKLIAPEEIRAFTYPGQSVLLPPDADIDEETGGVFSDNKRYTTTNDEVAAYAQITPDTSAYEGAKKG
jgi:hypothetical protein